MAGDILDPEVELKDKARAAVKAGSFYSRWLPGLAAGKGQRPSAFNEFGELAKHLRYVERSSRKLARSTFYGMTRWQAKLERKQGYLGRLVDIGAELFAISSAVVYADTIKQERPERGEQAEELAETCSAASHAGGQTSCSTHCGQTTTPTTTTLRSAARRSLLVARGGHRRPLR